MTPYNCQKTSQNYLSILGTKLQHYPAVIIKRRRPAPELIIHVCSIWLYDVTRQCVIMRFVAWGLRSRSMQLEC